MVPITAPNSQRGAQTRKFRNAVFERVSSPGNKIAGDNGQVALQLSGHAHGSTQLCDGHVRTDMNITQLRNAQPVESQGKIGDGNFDLAHVKPESLSKKAVCATYERYSAGNDPRGLKEISAGTYFWFFFWGGLSGGGV